jgi:transcriptional regulator with XRE-family HTH domain
MTGHPVERRRDPRDNEEAAAFKGLGQAVTVTRERRGLTREQLAGQCEMTQSELEKIERGEFDEWWGGLRRIAKAFGMPFPALMMEAEEFAPGRGGEDWRQSAREAEADSASTASSSASKTRGASSGSSLPPAGSGPRGTARAPSRTAASLSEEA